jgi:hypothetical protein
MRDELSLYFWSRKNQVGMLGAIVGVGLGVAGVVSGGLLLPLVPIGLYGAGALLMPNRKADQLLLDDTSDTRAVQRELDRLVITAREKLEPDLAQLVEQVETTVDEIFKRSGAQSASEALYVVRRTASNYLPLAVNQYLALPATYRTTHRGLKGDQNTPHEELQQQLTIMDEKMQQILEAILDGDATKLRQRGQFLRQKFGVDGDPDALKVEG